MYKNIDIHYNCYCSYHGNKPHTTKNSDAEVQPYSVQLYFRFGTIICGLLVAVTLLLCLSIAAMTVSVMSNTQLRHFEGKLTSKSKGGSVFHIFNLVQSCHFFSHIYRRNSSNFILYCGSFIDNPLLKISLL